MRLMAWLWWTPILSAVAIPLAWKEPASGPPSPTLDGREEDRTIIIDPDIPGGTSRARTVYNTVSLLCAVLLAILLGLRAKALKHNVLKKTNFTSILVILLYLFGLCFIFSASVVVLGQGLRTQSLCYSAIIICLIFYTSNKLLIYVFFLERARIVRSPFMARQKDWLWVTGMIIICGGFGTIAIVGYIMPISELSSLDGRCRIGLPLKVSLPVLGFDVVINFLLTGLFLWLLKPVLDNHGLSSLSGLFGSIRVVQKVKRRAWPSRPLETHIQARNDSVRILLWKCLIGSTLIMLPTVGNVAQNAIMKGRELSWICLTICTLDICFGVLIVNWLTSPLSAKAEERLTTSVFQRTISSEEQSPGLTPVRSRSSSVTPINASQEVQHPDKAATRGIQATATEKSERLTTE